MLATLDEVTRWGNVPWTLALFGFLGQALFFARFAVQWIASERERRSVVPRVFWYLSIGGSLVMLVYGFLRRDPVIVVGQATGTFVYVRNLMLSSHESAS